jgi:hypothetical protein
MLDRLCWVGELRFESAGRWWKMGGGSWRMTWWRLSEADMLKGEVRSWVDLEAELRM